MDLVCLVPDKSIEATMQALLATRQQAIRVRPIQFEIVTHPEHDPGCFLAPTKLLGGFVKRADHALIVLDAAWDGAPAQQAPELEQQLEQSLKSIGQPGWVRAVVIEPELEAWVFSDSPHVATTLGWKTTKELRDALHAQGLWVEDRAKPADPKRAMDWALKRGGVPRSSSLFRALASRVSLERCEDRSFHRLVNLLREWFPPNEAG
jgi:hypothetical protein